MCNFFSNGHTYYDLKKCLISGESIIQFENFYEYLGAEINYSSQFALAKIERVKKARKAIGLIKNFFLQVMFPSKLAKKLFEFEIEPNLTYGLIWATENSIYTALLTGTKITNQGNVRNIVPSLFKQSVRK